MEFDHFVYTTGEIDVYRKIGGHWQPWVAVRDSAILGSLGINQHGVYAVRSFRAGERIGRYTGKILGRNGDTQELQERLYRQNRGDALITVFGSANGIVVDGRRPIQSGNAQIDLVGRVVFDPSEYPGMYAYLMNDPTGTNFQANVQVTTGGYVQALVDIPAFDFNQSIIQNVSSELIWTYDQDASFLRDQQALGTSTAPIEIPHNNNNNV